MNKKIIEVKTKYGAHACIFEKDLEKGGFVVVAQKLPGVVTWGKNFNEAKKMAKEALELCIECLVEESVHERSEKPKKAIAAVTA